MIEQPLSDVVSEQSEQDAERKAFEDSVIKRHSLTTTPCPFSNDVRSVFGWTDATEYHEEVEVEVVTKIPEHQEKIRKLPVPGLEETVEMYLKTLEPLLTADEFDHAEEEAKDFLENAGPILQEKLKKRENDPRFPSWLEPWWDDSYLCGRDPIPINVNYFFGFEDDKDPDKMTQIGRAASLLHGALLFYQKFRTEKLDMDFERQQPLCMSQIRRVFGASRIPQIDRDKIITYTKQGVKGAALVSKTSEYSFTEPTDVVVLVGSKFFSFNVMGEGGVDMVTIPELEVLLQCCVEQSDAVGPGVPVELVTTMNRDEWAKVREKLIITSEINRNTLELIQKALIIVVLEDMAPTYDEELARVLLHGTGVNRWFDKHNLIICKNGRAGINFEHSVGDGATTLRVADEMYKHSLVSGRGKSQIEETYKEFKATGKGLRTHINPLRWVIDKHIENCLRDAYTGFKTAILGVETQILQFKQFGGGFIKTVAKMSPDAFVQIAIQLAYYKIFGKNDATYEAASTRSYLHGRTEVVRSATTEVWNFCKACCNTALTHRHAGQKVPTQLGLLREAVDAHVDYMRKAKDAHGVDRHLLGLRMIYEEAKEAYDFPLPALFRGVGYRRSSHWSVSTSHCGSSSLMAFGFGPVVAEGFGVGYMIKNSSISLTITSNAVNRTTSAGILSCLIEESLMHLKSIVLSDPALKKASSHPSSLDFSHPTTHTDELLVEWLRAGKRHAVE
eukprot:TRINITY_DN1286_c0_g1_i2.p1 TRINITY_DN1286_c0_g1~~TRINITY_DN1286_c0_g1_i2.p1  ORF type:complete len:752 (+),score=144.71 TRINITY_DN1286_c0_g1_i2:66-2258(+)